MKLKVKVKFCDKYTNENYNVNQVITVEKARGEELLADPRHLVELVKEKKVKER